MMVSPTWIHLFSLPSEYRDLDTLKDIENTLGEFIKVAEHNKVKRYTSFSRIYIYLDLSKELHVAISLNWEDEE